MTRRPPLRAMLAAFALLLASSAVSLAAEKRIALVIGESTYAAKPLATAANDAGLIAQTLQAAGFDVMGARDLDEEALRKSFRDFLDKASAAGPETVAFVYVSGYGVQIEGENYLLPVDAKIARDADVPTQAARVSDYLRPLSTLGLKGVVVVLDAARANPFTMTGAPLASGLALTEPSAGVLLAYNAAPGSIAPREEGSYGAYAHALAEMIRDGGLPLNEVFEKTRLRVADSTKGAQVPWHLSKITTPFMFFERTAEAPRVDPGEAAMRDRPIAELGPRDGYAAAVERDSMQGYQDFIAAYPRDPSAKRVRVMLAVRREARTWRDARFADTPNAYWTYLRRYPHGPHAADARRRLAFLHRELEPPESFDLVAYDVPPPPPEEIVYVDRPVIMFDDPYYEFAPPPPPPVYFLPPPPPNFVTLLAPVMLAEPYVLPMPVYVPIPMWQRPPAYIVAPPPNVIYENMHHSVQFDPGANHLAITDMGGHPVASHVMEAVGAGAAAVAIGAALPAFMNKKAPPAGLAPAGGPTLGGAPGGGLGAHQPGGPAGHVLPGGAMPLGGPAAGHALPGATGAAPLPGGVTPLPGGRPHAGGAVTPPTGPAAGGPAPIGEAGRAPLRGTGAGAIGQPPTGGAHAVGPGAPAPTVHRPPPGGPAGAAGAVGGGHAPLGAGTSPSGAAPQGLGAPPRGLGRAPGGPGRARDMAPAPHPAFDRPPPTPHAPSPQMRVPAPQMQMRAPSPPPPHMPPPQMHAPQTPMRAPPPQTRAPPPQTRAPPPATHPAPGGHPPGFLGGQR
jgi:uncharacterized caspase-like protein